MIFQRFNSLDFSEACADLFNQDFEDAEDWQRKYGVLTNPEAWSKYVYVINTYNQIEMFLKTREVDPELIFHLYHPNGIIHFWDKFRPVFMDIRERHEFPSYVEPFEYLFNEALKRYPSIRREDYMGYNPELKP
jgi:hypothetical protein